MADKIHIPWFHYFANKGMRTLFPLIVKLDIRGLENVPQQGPLLAAMNHTNFLDPALVAANLRPDVLPMAKIEAFKFPLNLLFHGYGAFPVRRGEGDLSAMKHSLQILRENHVMLISPEGTRTKSGTLQVPKEGIALLAVKSGAPILPVGLWGNKQLWHNLGHLRRTPVGMRVGEPLVIVVPTNKPTREVLRAITDELMYYIARLLPPEYRGRYADVENVVPHYVRPQRELALQPEAKKEVVSLQS